MLTEKATLAKGGACMACKLRKVKCTGTRPSCEACQRSARFRGEDPSTVICSYSKGRKCGHSGVGDDGTSIRGTRHAKRAYDESLSDAPTDGDVDVGSAAGAATKRLVLLHNRAQKAATRTGSPRRSCLTTNSGTGFPTNSISPDPCVGAVSSPSAQQVSNRERVSDGCAGFSPETSEPRASSTVLSAEPAKLFAAAPVQISATTTTSQASLQYPTPLSSPGWPSDLDDKVGRVANGLEPPGEDDATGSAVSGLASSLAFQVAFEQSRLVGTLQLVAAIPYFASPAPVSSPQALDPSDALTADADQALYTHAILPTAHNISDTISLPFFLL